ncbi:MAG: 3-dehydroquinate synthase, partial [Rhizomicrobium sp.]
LSVDLGLCSGQDAERFARHLKAVGLPTAVGAIPGARPPAEELLAHMGHDKKVKDGRMTFVLVRGIGKAFVTSDVPLDSVRKVLAA